MLIQVTHSFTVRLSTPHVDSKVLLQGTCLFTVWSLLFLSPKMLIQATYLFTVRLVMPVFGIQNFL